MLRRMLSLFRRSRFESDLDAELRDHMQKYADDLAAQGIPRAEAELRARREFGPVAQVKDEVRESSGLAWADSAARNFRYAFRALRKDPVFALTAIVTLALCIGANTAIFSVVDALLFRPLPYPQPDRLAAVEVFQRGPTRQFEQTYVTGTTWEYLRDHVQSLDAAVVSGTASVLLLKSGEGARYVRQMRVSSGFFRVLGVQPMLGREIAREEDRAGGPAVVVLGEPLWRAAFAADPSVLGRKILLRGEPYTVIGVMPASFETRPAAQLWTPLRPSTTGEGAGSNYEPLVRVRDGFTLDQANAELASAPYKSFLGRDLPKGITATLRLISVQMALNSTVRTPVLLLWASVGLVLLIGCVNVAGLMLARGGARRHEIATRLALGSGRAGILGQLLAESTLLAVAGGAGGLALGYAALQGLSSVAGTVLGLDQPIAFDLRVLAMTAATALFTSLLFGLYPAFAATRMDIRTALGSATRTASVHRGVWARQGLVVCEVALGMVLLVSAGLVLRTLANLTGLNPGYDGRGVLTATLPLQDARYSTSAEVNRLFNSTLDRIRQAPSVSAAGIGLTLPYERALNDGARVLDGPSAMSQAEITNLTYVTPGYFEALRFTLRAGRLFDDRDGAGSQPTAIVNETYVRQYLRGSTAIGRHLSLGGSTVEVVGVLADVQQVGSFGNAGPIATLPNVYVPASQETDRGFQMMHTWFAPKWVVRTSGARVETEQILRSAVGEVAPQLPFSDFRGMDEIRSASFTLQRTESVLLGTLAGLALVLAAIGIFGLIAHSVVQRTREFSIRLALGSSAWQAIAMAVRPGILLTVAGVAIGGGLTLWTGKLLQAILWGVQPNDATNLLLVASTLLFVAALASILPSLRIARIDPAQTLRDQ
jgi:predicted permease